MSVNQREYSDILRFRTVYFGSSEGMAVLVRELSVCGLFLEPDDMDALLAEDPANVRTLIFGISKLYQLGVWRRENFMNLIRAMATVPMPDLETPLSTGSDTMTLDGLGVIVNHRGIQEGTADNG